VSGNRGCSLWAVCNCGFGRKLAGPETTALPSATVPATDHTAMAAKAEPKEKTSSGRNMRRKNRTRETLLTNTYPSRQIPAKRSQVGKRPQLRDVRIVPILNY
jgi:hypothetical protein